MCQVRVRQAIYTRVLTLRELGNGQNSIVVRFRAKPCILPDFENVYVSYNTTVFLSETDTYKPSH